MEKGRSRRGDSPGSSASARRIVVHFLEFAVERFGFACLLLLAGKLHLLRRALFLAAVLFALGRGFGALVAALIVGILLVVFLGVAAEFVFHVESGQHVSKLAGEGRLVFDPRRKQVEVGAGLVLDPVAPKIDHAARRLRRLFPGQSFTHHQRERVLQGRFGAIADIGGARLEIAIFQHHLQIGGHAGHPVGADGVAARLFHRLEDFPPQLALRHELAMHSCVMAGDLQRHGIAQSPGDGDVGGRQPSRRFRHARGVTHQRRPV